MTTKIDTVQGAVDFCICKHCRRFWLERGGWLLSRREAAALLRTWPSLSQAAR